MGMKDGKARNIRVTDARGITLDFPDWDERISIRRVGNQLHIRCRESEIVVRQTGAVNSIILELEP
jgi:hypothetical protein